MIFLTKGDRSKKVNFTQLQCYFSHYFPHLIGFPFMYFFKSLFNISMVSPFFFCNWCLMLSRLYHGKVERVEKYMESVCYLVT